MKSLNVAVIEGDGIGPEIVAESLRVLKATAEAHKIALEFVDAPAGGIAYKKSGTTLPAESLEKCRKADMVIKGPVGLPDLPQGLVEREVVLGLRQELNLYVNLRPIKLYECLREMSPLKDRVIGKGIDYVIVRENSEGLYSKKGKVTEKKAYDLNLYSKKGVDRIISYAFELAKKAGKTKVTSVDKANVLLASKFWRERFNEIAKQYPGLKTESLYVDAMAQYQVRWPSSYEVVVTDNMFGDILSDLGAETAGSLGMGGSVNLKPRGVAMAEAIHGSAPDIAGKGIANPIGIILGVEYALAEKGFAKAAQAIESAVTQALNAGIRTKDIAPAGASFASTQKMGGEIANRIV
ncbi:MAG: isocitrate/isopropylmalate dehydrogenase family protein [Candidatus Micrarchaeia archaeon]|jgi:3-isopropylmalate dehydrogenase